MINIATCKDVDEMCKGKKLAYDYFWIKLLFIRCRRNSVVKMLSTRKRKDWRKRNRRKR